ncbi:MAG: hypothetical protein OZ924_15620 [Burkholderiaceae bacterium]|nr:hypothetical protein [Burkholderiaceae bacterium]
MNADRPTIDAVVDALHRLAGRGSDWESLESLRGELAEISPAAAARLDEPAFAAALIRGVGPTGRYIDGAEAPYPLVDDFESELEALFGASRAADIRATRRITGDESALMKKRWANRHLDDGLGMPFWIVELRSGDDRSAWVAICDDEEDGIAVWVAAATRLNLVRILTIWGYVDKPLSIETASADRPRSEAE